MATTTPTPAQVPQSLSDKISRLFSPIFDVLPDSQPSDVFPGGGDFVKDTEEKVKELNVHQIISNSTTNQHPSLNLNDSTLKKGIPATFTYPNPNPQANDTPILPIIEAKTKEYKPTLSLLDIQRQKIKTDNKREEKETKCETNELLTQNDSLQLQHEQDDNDTDDEERQPKVNVISYNDESEDESEKQTQISLFDLMKTQNIQNAKVTLNENQNETFLNDKQNENEQDTPATIDVEDQSTSDNIAIINNTLKQAKINAKIEETKRDGHCFYHATAKTMWYSARQELDCDDLISVSRNVIALLDQESCGMRRVCNLKQFENKDDALVNYAERFGHPLVDGMIYCNWFNLPYCVIQCNDEGQVSVSRLLPDRYHFDEMTVEQFRDKYITDMRNRALTVVYDDEHYYAINIERGNMLTHSAVQCFRYEYYHYVDDTDINQVNLSPIYVNLSEILLTFDLSPALVRAILHAHDPNRTKRPFHLASNVCPLDLIPEEHLLASKFRSLEQLQDHESRRYKELFFEIPSVMSLIVGMMPEIFAGLMSGEGEVYNFTDLMLQSVDRIAEYQHPAPDGTDFIIYNIRTNSFYHNMYNILFKDMPITDESDFNTDDENDTLLSSSDSLKPQHREENIRTQIIKQYATEFLDNYALDTRASAKTVQEYDYFKEIIEKMAFGGELTFTKNFVNNMTAIAKSCDDPFQIFTIALAKEFKSDVLVHFPQYGVLDHFIGYDSVSLLFCQYDSLSGSVKICKMLTTKHAPLHKTYILHSDFFLGNEIRTQLYNQYFITLDDDAKLCMISNQVIVKNRKVPKCIRVPTPAEQANTAGRAPGPNGDKQRIYTGVKGKAMVSILQPDIGYPVLNRTKAQFPSDDAVKSTKYILRTIKSLFTEVPMTHPRTYIFRIYALEDIRAIMYVHTSPTNKRIYVTFIFFDTLTANVSVSLLPRIVYRINASDTILYTVNTVGKVYTAYTDAIISDFGEKERKIVKSLTSEYMPRVCSLPHLNNIPVSVLTAGIFSSLSVRADVNTKKMTSFTTKCTARGIVTTIHNDGQQVLCLGCGFQTPLCVMDLHKHACTLRHHALTINENVNGHLCSKCDTYYPNTLLAQVCGYTCIQKH